MTPRDAVVILLRSGAGRLGALFLAILLLASVFVLLRFPLDFGSSRWNNPLEWSDNPKAVPPAWTSLFKGDDAVPHTVFLASEPDSVAPAGATQVRTYTLTYDFDRTEPPSFISFTLSGVTFKERPPVLSVDVARPDGKVITLYQSVVRGPRPGEEPPYSRYHETPFRVFLSGDQDTLVLLSTFLRQQFSTTISTQALQGKVENVVFGTPAPDRPGAFDPLQGTYRITVRAIVGDPSDTIESVKLVLGGTVYGVMGTDSLGRDLAMGLLFGFPVALAIGLSTSIFATTIGTFMGILSGFMGGKTDIAIQRFTDVWSNIPLLPILIFLIFILHL